VRRKPNHGRYSPTDARLVGKARIGEFPRDALAFNRKRPIGRPGEATDASASDTSVQTATAPQEDIFRPTGVKTGDSGSGVNFLSQTVVRSGSSVSICEKPATQTYQACVNIRLDFYLESITFLDSRLRKPAQRSEQERGGGRDGGGMGIG